MTEKKTYRYHMIVNQEENEIVFIHEIKTRMRRPRRRLKVIGKWTGPVGPKFLHYFRDIFDLEEWDESDTWKTDYEKFLEVRDQADRERYEAMTGRSQQ